MLSRDDANMTADVFKCIFDTYKNRLYCYVLTISHSPYVAEEITQEIFLKLWLCRDLLNGIKNTEAYIFAIARNKTLNHLRKAAHNSEMLRYLQDRMNPACNNVEESATVSEYQHLMEEAMNLLSPRRRQVFKLSRQQGLNSEEIASHLQLSRNTVKNHLVKALSFIRAYVGKHVTTIVLILFFSVGNTL